MCLRLHQFAPNNRVAASLQVYMPSTISLLSLRTMSWQHNSRHLACLKRTSLISNNSLAAIEKKVKWQSPEVNSKAVSIKMRTQSGSKKAKMGHHQNRSPGGWREKSVHLDLGSWRFMWRARWSERAKQRSQTLHLKGLAPVCFRMWRVSSSDLAKRHWQLWKWHLYGFSPVKEK